MTNSNKILPNLRFDPFRFNSTLNNHSSSTDTDCNIDTILSSESNCNYYSVFKPSANHLSLFHLNARSLNKRANDVVNYMATLNIRFQIYAFTETWFRDNDDANLIDLEDYVNINCNRQDRRGGGASLAR